MCENLSPDRIRCEACRTINLAKQGNQPKPDMAPYEKCSPTKKIDCGRITELPLNPTCIKVCSKEEFLIRQRGGPKTPKIRPPPYGHGKLMYAVKAGLLVGAVYFTYTQGVWGDQQDVTECVARWSEYIRSINTRRPPVYDKCGRVVRKENPESIIAPAYDIYKNFITTCFAEQRQRGPCGESGGAGRFKQTRFVCLNPTPALARAPRNVALCEYIDLGVVKMPLVIKCAYFDYLKEMEKKEAEDLKERKIMKRGKA